MHTIHRKVFQHHYKEIQCRGYCCVEIHTQGTQVYPAYIHVHNYTLYIPWDNATHVHNAIRYINVCRLYVGCTPTHI